MESGQGYKKNESLIKLLERKLQSDQHKQLFEKLFGNCVYFLVEDLGKLSKNFEKEISRCKIFSGSGIDHDTCRASISEMIKKSGSAGKIGRFSCELGSSGICYPIIQGDKLYGYLVICRAEKQVSDEMLELLSSFMDVSLSDTQKESELKKLYDTIRPRAIALSTVHTLHRLISSTLNLNELLPRIARLTLQVMRANRCSIKLVDSKRKTLLPKSTVDLRAKITKLKKVQIGKWAPGKAVKFGKSIRGRDFLATPLIDEDVIGVITVYDKVDKKPFTDFDEEIMKTLCEQAVIAIRNAQLYKDQERMTIGSIKSIAAIMETKAPGTFLPKASFLKLVHMVGVELKLSEYELKCLEYASLLHDAGQITLPDQLTNKKGVLTGEEYNMIKEHPQKAAIILKPLKALKNVVPIILHHHENFDGTGYPNGLKKEEIPIGARIMGVVGSFEAMITHRHYRKHMTIKNAVEEIKSNSGKQFDPNVVRAFLVVMNKKGILKMLRKEIYGSKKISK